MDCTAPLARGGFSAACPVTVVGSGNWLLSCDRVGPQVLAAIRERYGPEVELGVVGSHGLAVLDYLHHQDLLIVVDACVGMGIPGEVMLLEPDLDSPPGRETSVHQIGPVEALLVGRHLYPEKMPRRALLLLIETEGLDPPGEAESCRKAVDLLDHEINAWRRGSSVPPTGERARDCAAGR